LVKEVGWSSKRRFLTSTQAAQYKVYARTKSSGVHRLFTGACAKGKLLLIVASLRNCTERAKENRLCSKERPSYLSDYCKYPNLVQFNDWCLAEELLASPPGLSRETGGSRKVAPGSFSWQGDESSLRYCRLRVNGSRGT